jgi:hypothetical protein
MVLCCQIVNVNPWTLHILDVPSSSRAAMITSNFISLRPDKLMLGMSGLVYQRACIAMYLLSFEYADFIRMP